MNTIATSEDFGVKILDILGLQNKGVKSISISVSAFKPVEVTCTLQILSAQGDALAEELQKYRLQERTDSPESN